MIVPAPPSALWGLPGIAGQSLLLYQIISYQMGVGTCAKDGKEVCNSILTTVGNEILLDSVPPNILWLLEVENT